MMTIFTPSFADDANTNAQNLTVKEIVARLPSEQFRVIMIRDGIPDPRIAARQNTELLRLCPHGNTVHLLARCLAMAPDVYFFPREGPLDSWFMTLRRKLRLRTALVTYVVSTVDQGVLSAVARSIVEADVVFGNSIYVAQTVTQRFGMQAGTIHSGINRLVFFPRGGNSQARLDSQLVVLYAGSFQARKRVHLVVREAARWPQVQFRLVGRGELEQSCRSLASELGCQNVTFVGHVSPSQLSEEMRRADVFLFPSVIEGHPQVLGQAAACGLPCVATNVYHPDYVVNGKTGFLVESDKELTQKLDLLLRDSTLREAMSAAAVQHAREFDWDRVTEQWQQVFQTVTEERQRRSHVRDIRHL
jgi:glycosyltransferase involved in cell wall biosynthesis